MKLNLSVILVHILLIALFVFAKKPPQNNPSPIKVNTYLIQVPIQVQPKMAIEKKPAQPTQVVKKPPSQTQTKPAQPKQVVKKTPNPSQLKKEKLISLVQEGLETMNSPPSGEKNRKIGTLHSETLNFKTNYDQELMLYLQTLLTLPEKGEVKLLCTLNREGVLQNMKILTSSCDQNTLYVKEMLSNITLPPFGSHFAGETTHTFSLVFTSENSH